MKFNMLAFQKFDFLGTSFFLSDNFKILSVVLPNNFTKEFTYLSGLIMSPSNGIIIIFELYLFL